MKPFSIILFYACYLRSCVRDVYQYYRSEIEYQNSNYAANYAEFQKAGWGRTSPTTNIVNRFLLILVSPCLPVSHNNNVPLTYSLKKFSGFWVYSRNNVKRFFVKSNCNCAAPPSLKWHSRMICGENKHSMVRI